MKMLYLSFLLFIIALIIPSSAAASPIGVTPTIFCVGGAGEPPCAPINASTSPSPAPSGIGTNPSTSPPAGGTKPSTSPTPSGEPCAAKSEASIMHNKGKNKDKKKFKDGNTGGSIERFIKRLLKLIEELLKRFGNTPPGTPLPDPGTPNPDPDMSPTPCPEPSAPEEPSNTPEPTVEQPTAGPTVAATPTVFNQPTVITTPTIVPSIGLVKGQVLWRGDPDAGRNQWSKEHVINPSRITIETIDGRKAWKMQLNDGDRFSGERVEFGQDDDESRDFNEGDDVWVGYSVYLPSDFPTDVKWTVLHQWKDQDPDGGSPSWGLYVQNNKIEVDGQLANKAFSTPATKNIWHNLVWHMKLDSSNNGLVQIFHSTGNNVPVQVVSKTQKTYRPPSSKLVPRIGYYRDPAISTNNAVYHAGWTVGTSFDAVNPVR